MFDEVWIHTRPALNEQLLNVKSNAFSIRIELPVAEAFCAIPLNIQLLNVNPEMLVKLPTPSALPVGEVNVQLLIVPPAKHVLIVLLY